MILPNGFNLMRAVRIALIASFSALPLCLSPGLNGQAVPTEVRLRIENRAQAILNQLFAKSDFPGGSLAIVLPDESSITVTAGVSSRRTDEPMKSTDRMMSGSIGKTYFAALAMKLLLQKDIALDDKVSKYLGDREWFARIPNSNALTIAMLMRHQSGLPRYIENQKLWADVVESADKEWQPGEQLTYIFDESPLHPPGEGWAYSDTNYILLGMLMEQVTGHKVYDSVNDSFLKPNALSNTVPNNRREIGGLVPGYTKMFQPLGLPEEVVQDGKFVMNPAMEWCGGGYASNPLDLAIWAHVLYSGSLFESAYVEKMVDGALEARMLGPGTRYGLGLMIRDTRIGLLLGHDGVFPGYMATMGYSPQQKTSAAFMINSDGAAISQPMYQILVDVIEMVAAELDNH